MAHVGQKTLPCKGDCTCILNNFFLLGFSLILINLSIILLSMGSSGKSNPVVSDKIEGKILLDVESDLGNENDMWWPFTRLNYWIKNNHEWHIKQLSYVYLFIELKNNLMCFSYIDFKSFSVIL